MAMRDDGRLVTTAVAMMAAIMATMTTRLLPTSERTYVTEPGATDFATAMGWGVGAAKFGARGLFLLLLLLATGTGLRSTPTYGYSVSDP